MINFNAESVRRVAQHNDPNLNIQVLKRVIEDEVDKAAHEGRYHVDLCYKCGDTVINKILLWIEDNGFKVAYQYEPDSQFHFIKISWA